ADGTSGGFVPPMIGGADSNALLGLVTLAILLAIPQIIDGVQKMFGADDSNSPFGAAAMGGALGAALGTTGNVAASPFKYGAGVVGKGITETASTAVGTAVGNA